MQELSKNTESSILSLNKRAMEKLRENSYNEAFEFLTEAERLLKSSTPDEQILAITMNNYGSYYKKLGKFQEALSCLNIALGKERKVNKDPISLAGTHLSICTVYSAMGVHETSLSHALSAVKILQKYPGKNIKVFTTLIIAYHNSGLEYEFLLRNIEAMNMYKAGWDLSKDKLGESHPLSQSIKKSLQNAIENENHSEIIPVIKQSRSSIRKPKSSSSRLSQRKCTSSIQRADKNSFPSISMKENLSSFAYTDKPRVRKAIRSADKYQRPALIPQPPKRQVLTFNKRKYEALQSLIEELEGSCKKSQEDVFPLNSLEFSKDNSNLLEVKDAVQIIAPKIFMDKQPMDIQKGWRKYRKAEKRRKENIELKVYEAEIKANEALREVERLKLEKITLEKNEKKDFFRHKHLQTIYESKYEDQREAVVMIQSHFRKWIDRKRYLKMKSLIQKIQKNVRMYIVRSLFKNIISAAVFIQSVYRGYRVRKMYKPFNKVCDE